MERLTTSIDQHGRMLIPSYVRERFNIYPGEKVILEINQDQINIVNADHVINEMHNIFTKNQTVKKDSVVDDFINQKRQEYFIEEIRGNKGDV